MPYIKTVELDQIESAQYRGVVMLAKTEEIEDRQALPIDDDRLPIDNTRAALSEMEAQYAAAQEGRGRSR